MASTESKTVLGEEPSRGNILEFYTEEFKPQASPGALFKQHVIEWFFAAKHLRRFEAMRLCDKQTQEDLASHRLICSALITFGEFATNFIKSDKNVGVDLLSV